MSRKKGKGRWARAMEGVDLSKAIDTLKDRPGPKVPGRAEDSQPSSAAFSRFDAVNKARARSAPGALNKTEMKRAEELEAQRIAGKIQGWLAQAWTFTLGHRCSYRPDFVVVLPSGEILLEEVKGSRAWKLDPKGRVKWKVAAEMNPFLLFRGVVLTGQGAWEIEEYEPRAAWPPVRPE